MCSSLENFCTDLCNESPWPPPLTPLAPQHNHHATKALVANARALAAQGRVAANCSADLSLIFSAHNPYPLLNVTRASIPTDVHSMPHMYL